MSNSEASDLLDTEFDGPEERLALRETPVAQAKSSSGWRALKPVLITFLVIYFVYALLAQTPASLATWAAHKAIPQLWLTSPKGTLWQGRAGGAQMDLGEQTVALGSVSWELSPWTLLTLEPCLSFETQGDGPVFSGSLCHSPFGASRVENLSADFPVALIQEFLPVDATGMVSAQIISAAGSPMPLRIDALDARFSLQNVSANTGESWMYFGDFGGQLNANGAGGVTAKLFDISGPFGLDLDGNWTPGDESWNIQADISPRPEAPALATQGLQMIAEESEPGTFRVIWP